MSASERLRALGQTPFNTALSHHVGTLTETEHKAGVSAIASVFLALPLIADVVEAAEKLTLTFPEGRPARLTDALSALQEHLETKTP